MENNNENPNISNETKPSNVQNNNVNQNLNNNAGKQNETANKFNPKQTPQANFGANFQPPKAPSSFQGTNFSNSILNKPMQKLAKQPIENKKVERTEQVNKGKSKPPKGRKVAIALTCIAAYLVLQTLVCVSLVFFILPYRPADINIQFEVEQRFLNTPSTDTEPLKMRPGDSVDCEFIVRSKKIEEGNHNEDVFVRIRSYAICEGNYYPDFCTFELLDSTKWFVGADGYFYYNDFLSVDEEIETVRSIKINNNLDNSFAGKTITIVFSAEALQGEYQALETWPTAPYDWKKSFK